MHQTIHLPTACPALPTVSPEDAALPTTLTFHGASVCWRWQEGWLLCNCGAVPVWAGVTLRIPSFHRQSWQNACDLGRALHPAWQLVHLNPEGVTAVRSQPLEPGEQCPVMARYGIPAGIEPYPIELQGVALPSSGLTRDNAAHLLLPIGGVR